MYVANKIMATTVIYSFRYLNVLEEEMDKETLSELAHLQSYDQLKACGFIKIKDQVKLRRLLQGSSSVPEKSAVIRSGQGSKSHDGKLSLQDMKKLSSDDKRLYLLK